MKQLFITLSLPTLIALSKVILFDKLEIETETAILIYTTITCSVTYLWTILSNKLMKESNND